MVYYRYKLTKTQVNPEVIDIFNKNKFKAVCVERNLTLEQVADILGINEVTLYRKMSGKSDFTRTEIQMFKMSLGLKSEEIDAIFFS